MSSLTGYGICYGCGSLIAFNPELVPVIQVDGREEPLCRACIDIANSEREK